MKKRSMVILAGTVICAACLIIAFTVFTFRKFVIALKTFETAENVPSVKELPHWLCDLPASARNISYSKRPLLETIYEYELNEDDFLKWAQANKFKLSKIIGVAEIRRFHALRACDTGDPNAVSTYESKRQAVVYHGYEYHTEQDNGGGLDLVYDLYNRKAYIDYRFR
ncbi:MAG: hypothetical protein LLF76_07975 [Planctomycetaceae bacterium]|nr:hypothetical protein [Planctomycetaceae bacterium]